MSGVYREPNPPPCAACAARAEAASAMERFERPALVECPKCGAERIDDVYGFGFTTAISYWGSLCTGGTLTRKKHWWARREIVHVCTVSEPPHFHFQCNKCGHHWLMRTRKS